MPPEINTSRLMTGAGAGPMLQAAEGWQAFAISLETQADELAASLAALAAAWSGAASDRAVAATMPMIIWLRTASLQAQKRALQAAAQATSYTAAMAGTPPIPEIEQNHVTHAVLEATNFFGVNTVPIGMNEFDYFVRMWNQAAAVMDAYQAETTANTLFEPIPPMTPIVLPGVGESVMATAMGTAAAMAPGAAARDLVFTQVGAQASVESAALQGGRGAATANQVATHTESQIERADDPRMLPQDQLMQQGGQQGVQMATQLASTLTQIPQQAGQMLTSPMQQLTQPLQQVSSMFSQMGMGSGGDKGAQMGLIGASPLSNHPLAGGAGPSSGAGMVRAASLPGAGGTSPRSSLMSSLLHQQENQLLAAAVVPGAAAGAAGGGLAPVGAGGGGMPMGMMGHGTRGKSGGTRAGLTAPGPLTYDLAEDEEDDW